MFKKILAASILFIGTAHAQMPYGVTQIPTICMPTQLLITDLYKEDWTLTVYGRDSAEEDVIFYIFRKDTDMFIVKEYQQSGISCLLGYAEDTEEYELPSQGNPT